MPQRKKVKIQVYAGSSAKSDASVNSELSFENRKKQAEEPIYLRRM
jgi:hypothetical protein